MIADKVRIKWVVNSVGEPTVFTESVLEVHTTILDIKNKVFGQEITRGMSVRIIFLGRELPDSDSLIRYLRIPARAAEAGVCATTATAAGPCNGIEVTLHAIISNRPAGVRTSETRGISPGSTTIGDADWSIVVLAVTVLVILCFCWYHRILYPADFTPLSFLLLVLFTGLYAFAVRKTLLYLMKMAFRFLKRGWPYRNRQIYNIRQVTQSQNPSNMVDEHQELSQQPT